MIVRIFLPDALHSLKSIDPSKFHLIFGEIECNSDGNVSIFIVDTKETGKTVDWSQQHAIGCISPENETRKKQLPDNDFIEFLSGDNGEDSALHLKTLHLPNFISSGKPFQMQMFLYNFRTFSDLAQRIEETTWCHRSDVISQLLALIKCEQQKNCMSSRLKSAKRDSKDSQKLPPSPPSSANPFFAFLVTVSLFIQTNLSYLNSSFVRHFHFWTANLEKLLQNRVHIWTILLDVMAGIGVMFWLWHITNAGDYLIHLAMFIVRGLQNLLDALKGSPVGLKLNVDLNNFFIECFRYHVDLWGTFLIIISPLVKYLFAPLAIIGCFGLSFQLSMLSDILNIITLHSHCIYTYASIIYKIEINGLVGVWRVVSGRRKNILKDRIESYEYSNPQLYLSIIFFTAFLFLLPTILIYYVVFASLRLCLYCITSSLTWLQRKLLSLPIFYIAKWCMGQYASSVKYVFATDLLVFTNFVLYNFEVIFLGNTNNNFALNDTPLALFSIKSVRSSFPSWIQVVVANET